jgi:hypothetical protein
MIFKLLNKYFRTQENIKLNRFFAKKTLLSGAIIKQYNPHNSRNTYAQSLIIANSKSGQEKRTLAEDQLKCFISENIQ